eukprot:jgi/Psemu1/65509/estExt_Genemark1.C_1300060
MDFDLSSDSSSDESSVVDVSMLLPGKSHNKNNCHETKNVAHPLGEDPSRLNTTGTEGKPIGKGDFHFGCDSSSDSTCSSVVDFSKLLPSDNIQNNKSDELKDAPCQLNSEAKIDSTRNGNYMDNDRDKSKQTDAASASVIQSPKKLTEKSKDNVESKNNRKRGMIRVVMGESVKVWRRQRNSSQNNKTTNTQNNNIGHPSIPSYGKHPNYTYAVLQNRDSSPDPRTNHNRVATKTEFENSHLHVQRRSDGNNDKIEMILNTSERHDAEHATVARSPQTISYTAKKFKRQLSHHQNQASLSSTPLSASTFVDCIALWEPKRGVYVLEVPELIANDVTMTARPDDNYGDGIHGSENHDGRHNSDRRRQDPLEQQRQAEIKLQNHRKRRRS